MSNTENTSITEIQKQVSAQLADKETMNTLVSTTFKGLQPANIKLAIVEGVLRGFKFEDFLHKNVYAIPFEDKRSGKQVYTLMTSLDYARKLGMRSGVVGKSEPIYEEQEGKIVSCSVTIKRKVGDYIGDYTAKVFFTEYNTGRNLWTSKPRTMIAKVAEMHALRSACPEAMSQLYVEEEMEKEIHGKKSTGLEPIDIETYGKKLEECRNLEELGMVWSVLPMSAKTALKELKDKLKEKLS